ncbi:MAG: nicotinic acid mononucleotide adenylyltransferase [Aestuariivita sp.]|nr:nicotinic acid mononucleotide adenylyltransferase [Aestuariivita sp.]
MKIKTVGLLGGSFDPAHAGHVNITKAALICFNLDEVWWLVSPGSPIKKASHFSFKSRLEFASQLIQHPRVRVTDIEKRIGTIYTADTLSALTHSFPKIQFVWLMGADNFVQFDQWRHWQRIMHKVPVGILARPGNRLAPLSARTARVFRLRRIATKQSRRLAKAQVPSWCYINLPMSHLSSSAIRISSHH